MATTIESLRPGAKGVTVVVKVDYTLLSRCFSFLGACPDLQFGLNRYLQVIDAKVVVDRPKGHKGTGGSKIAECIVGDATASILFSVRDDQGEANPFA